MGLEPAPGRLLLAAVCRRTAEPTFLSQPV